MSSSKGRAGSLRRAGPNYDIANPPEGVRLCFPSVATRLNLTITDMAVAADISRTGIADMINNKWPVKKPRRELEIAISELLASKGATDAELATLWHAYGRQNGTRGAGEPRGPDRTEPVSPNGHVPSPHPVLGVAPAISALTNQEKDMLPMKATLSFEARRQFKLVANPFDKVRADTQMFRGSEFDYVTEAGWQCAMTSGFVAIVGESGAGKTTAMAELEARIERERGERVVVIKPSVLGLEGTERLGTPMKSTDILHAILSTLAPDQPMPQTAQARTVRAQRLLTGGVQTGTNYLVIVEEAHCLPDATLKHLKRLNELAAGRRNLLGVLLLAQPELKERLARGMLDGTLREVAQRCEIVELMPLDGDIKPYLQTRCRAVNVELAALMDDKAIEAIRDRLTVKRGGREISLAYPQAVNNMVIHALNKAAGFAPLVTAEIVRSI